MNKKIERLHELAYKAAVARDKFEDALEKAKGQRDWEAICLSEGLYPNANPGDWMC